MIFIVDLFVTFFIFNKLWKKNVLTKSWKFAVCYFFSYLYIHNILRKKAAMKRNPFVVSLFDRIMNLCLNDNVSLFSLIYLFYLCIFFHLSQNSLTNCRRVFKNFRRSWLFIGDDIHHQRDPLLIKEFHSVILHIEAKLLHPFPYCTTRTGYFSITLM